MGMSRGPAGSIPPTPRLGTALALPSLSFSAERFRTRGINNPRHPRAVPTSCPSASFRAQVCNPESSSRQTQGGGLQRADTPHCTAETPAPLCPPSLCTGPAASHGLNPRPTTANPRLRPTHGWVPAEGLSTHTCSPVPAPPAADIPAEPSLSPAQGLGFAFPGEFGPGFGEVGIKVNGELPNSSGPPQQVIWREKKGVSQLLSPKSRSVQLLWRPVPPFAHFAQFAQV